MAEVKWSLDYIKKNPISNDDVLEMWQKGIVFKKEDLTKELLFKLCLEDNIIDTNIGSLFNLNKNQVKYLRRKYGLENIFLRKTVDNFDKMKQTLLDQSPSLKNFNDDEVTEAIIKVLKAYAELKGYKPEVLDRYIDEAFNKDKGIQNIKVVSGELISREKSDRKYHKGKNINQMEASINKIDAGKLGEKIVKKYEKEKLFRLGKYGLANKVDIISQVDDKITHDGDGYDVISFNEDGEEIYIEVKSSMTTSTNHVKFNISKKELDFINGKVPGYDKEHTFIYYVTNMEKDKIKGDIRIINYKELKKYNLEAVTFQADEYYQ